jgi:deoxyribonuclease V
MAGVKPVLVHDWDLPLEEARELQERLAARVEETDRLGEVHIVAGVDVSYDRKSPLVCAAVVLMDAATGQVVERTSAVVRASFPYVPGLFSFREIPPLLVALRRLRQSPDLLLCDGQGRAHPRRFGLACHLGVLLDLPSIGCAKSLLVGTHREPGLRRGAHTPLRDRGEIVGEVVRTREGVRPVYVSVGHRVSLESARFWVLRLASRYRLPEPIRAADALAGRLRREMHEAGGTSPPRKGGPPRSRKSSEIREPPAKS